MLDLVRLDNVWLDTDHRIGTRIEFFFNELSSIIWLAWEGLWEVF